MEGVLAHDLRRGHRTDDVRLKEVAPFNQWLLRNPVKKGLERAGFYVPTDMQASAIPVGKAGIDLLVKSKSGTGKTLIFCTILLENCLDTPGPHSLIIAPTREIAIQIQSVLQMIAKYCKGYEVISAIGGTDIAEDRKKLQRAQTVVGTPGRIVHLIKNDNLKTSSIKFVVLDEADQLYGSSHRKNLECILSAVNAERQIIACSATFSGGLDAALAQIMDSPLLISSNDPVATLLGIKQFVYEMPDQPTSVTEMEAKIKAVDEIFKRVSFKLCLVFASSQSRAETYQNYLNTAGWNADLISAALSQEQRNVIFAKFRTFTTRIIVTTDVLARGIDSEHVNLVINMEPPRDMVTYLHRTGRAGRFGSLGMAITLVASKKDDKSLRRILNEIGSDMEIFKFPKVSEKHKATSSCEPAAFQKDSCHFELYYNRDVPIVKEAEVLESGVVSDLRNSIELKTVDLPSKHIEMLLADNCVVSSENNALPKIIKVIEPQDTASLTSIGGIHKICEASKEATTSKVFENSKNDLTVDEVKTIGAMSLPNIKVLCVESYSDDFDNEQKGIISSNKLEIESDRDTASNENGNDKICDLNKADIATPIQSAMATLVDDNKTSCSLSSTENLLTTESVEPKETSTENLFDTITSIDTKTFLIDSKDSAVNIHPITGVEMKENILASQPEETPNSNRSSIQLSLNTIDDASSIAADSVLTTQPEYTQPHPSPINPAPLPLFKSVIDHSNLHKINHRELLKADIFMDFSVHGLDANEEDNSKNETDTSDKSICREPLLLEPKDHPIGRKLKCFDDMFADYTNYIRGSADNNDQLQLSIDLTSNDEISKDKEEGQKDNAKTCSENPLPDVAEVIKTIGNNSDGKDSDFITCLQDKAGQINQSTDINPPEDLSDNKSEEIVIGSQISKSDAGDNKECELTAENINPQAELLGNESEVVIGSQISKSNEGDNKECELPAENLNPQAELLSHELEEVVIGSEILKSDAGDNKECELTAENINPQAELLGNESEVVIGNNSSKSDERINKEFEAVAENINPQAKLLNNESEEVVIGSEISKSDEGDTEEWEPAAENINLQAELLGYESKGVVVGSNSSKSDEHNNKKCELTAENINPQAELLGNESEVVIGNNSSKSDERINTEFEAVAENINPQAKLLNSESKEVVIASEILKSDEGEDEQYEPAAEIESNEDINNDNGGLEQNPSPINDLWMAEYWRQVNFIQAYSNFILQYRKQC